MKHLVLLLLSLLGSLAHGEERFAYKGSATVVTVPRQGTLVFHETYLPGGNGFEPLRALIENPNVALVGDQISMRHYIVCLSRLNYETAYAGDGSLACDKDGELKIRINSTYPSTVSLTTRLGGAASCVQSLRLTEFNLELKRVILNYFANLNAGGLAGELVPALNFSLGCDPVIKALTK